MCSEKQKVTPKLTNLKLIKEFVADHTFTKEILKKEQFPSSKPFIYFAEISCEKFMICFTTKTLLMNAILQFEKDFGLLAVDGTYKLLELGYPTLVLATVDREHEGYLIGFAVSIDESERAYTVFMRETKNCLSDLFNFKEDPSFALSDASEAIRNSFLKNYKEPKLILCNLPFSEFGKKIQQQRIFSSKNKNENDIEEFKSFFDDPKTIDPKIVIKNDLKILQFLPTKKMFENYWTIISPFWHDYFYETYIKRFSGWQCFIKFRFPSTNNSLEAANRYIKGSLKLSL